MKLTHHYMVNDIRYKCKEFKEKQIHRAEMKKMRELNLMNTVLIISTVADKFRYK